MDFYGARLRERPNDVGLLFGRAAILIKKGLHKEALETLSKILRLDPDHLAGRNLKVDIEIMLNGYEEALIDLDILLERDPKNEKYWTKRAKALGKIGRFEEALQCIDTAIELNSDYREAWYERGRLIREMEKAPEERRMAAEDKGPEYTEFLEECQRLTERGDFSHKIGIRDDAEKHYLNALNKCTAADLDGTGWLQKGILLKKLDRLEEALLAFNHALSLDCKLKLAWYEKCKVLSSLGMSDSSAASFINGLKVDLGVTPEENGNEGDAFSLELGEMWDTIESNEIARDSYGEQIGRCTDALCENPKSWKIWFVKGLLLLKKEDLNEAIECFDTALAIRPDCPEAWEAKGAALKKMGAEGEGDICLDRAVQLTTRDLERYKDDVKDLLQGEPSISDAAIFHETQESHFNDDNTISCPECDAPLDVGNVECSICGLRFQEEIMAEAFSGLDDWVMVQWYFDALENGMKTGNVLFYHLNSETNLIECLEKRVGELGESDYVIVKARLPIDPVDGCPN